MVASMIDKITPQIVDLSFFILANLFNGFMVGIFIARKRGLERVEYCLGLILISLMIPAGILSALNFTSHREWWTFYLPLLVFLFLLAELILDYLLKTDFRNGPLLFPYLALYYLALLGMIGYTFLIGRVYGYITLFTYFLNQGATWYAHSDKPRT